jgi:hypothetical protein
LRRGRAEGRGAFALDPALLSSPRTSDAIVPPPWPVARRMGAAPECLCFQEQQALGVAASHSTGSCRGTLKASVLARRLFPTADARLLRKRLEDVEQLASRHRDVAAPDRTPSSEPPLWA